MCVNVSFIIITYYCKIWVFLPEINSYLLTYFYYKRQSLDACSVKALIHSSHSSSDISSFVLDFRSMLIKKPHKWREKAKFSGTKLFLSAPRGIFYIVSIFSICIFTSVSL